jgi:hypothetical protein
MYQRVVTKNVVISPKQAEQLLKLNAFEGQRPIGNDWVQDLAQEITAGRFRRGDIAIARKSFNGGEEVLVNGQHQLHACILTGQPIFATVEHYDCPDADDLWHLFGSFDGHRRRSEGHVMKAARGLFKSDPLRGVPLSVLRTCGTALMYLGGGTKPNFSARPSNRCRKTELVQQYESDVVRVNGYNTNDTKHMMTVPVVTAIISTHRANADMAPEFWERVLYGDGLSRNSPQFKLHQKLAQGKNFIIAGISNGHARNAAIYCICASWWNAWRTGEDRKIVQAKNMTSVPEVAK